MAITDSFTPKDDRDLWATPQAVYDYLDRLHGPFTLDVAANAENHKCPMWLGPGGLWEDALDESYSWADGYSDRPAVFCNPPYSRGMVSKFVAKAKHEAQQGICVPTLLLPAATDTRWYHQYVWDHTRRRIRPGVDVQFWEGRIRFVRPDGTVGDSPPSGSIIVTIYG